MAGLPIYATGKYFDKIPGEPPASPSNPNIHSPLTDAGPLHHGGQEGDVHVNHTVMIITGRSLV